MKSKIDGLLKQDYSSLDPILQSHILNYICVLISGYLEKEITAVLLTYKKSGHYNSLECLETNKITSISNKAGKGIQNAKWCSIVPFFINIDAKIISNFKKMKDFDLIKQSIDDIVKTRHKIAHGENVTNLTMHILKDHFKNIQKFLKQLQKIFAKF